MAVVINQLAVQKEALPILLETQIGAVTQNHRYREILTNFFLQTNISTAAQIDYELRLAFEKMLTRQTMSIKRRKELMCLFDHLKIKHIAAITAADRKFHTKQSFFLADQIFLLYIPNQEVAKSFLYVPEKMDLLWDFTRFGEMLKEQGKRLLCAILNMDLAQKMRGNLLRPLKAFLLFCREQGIDQIEELSSHADEQFVFFAFNKYHIPVNGAKKILEFSKRTLFLTDEVPNWNASIWYLDRFSFDKTRINESCPIRSLSFQVIERKENRILVQNYVRYQIGITDASLKKIQSELCFIKHFVLFLEEQGSDLSKFNKDSMDAYVALPIWQDCKESTFNRYITTIARFLRFLACKQLIPPLSFDTREYTKKTYAIHNERMLPFSVLEQMMETLPAFPEHLQMMYLIVLCTGIRKSEVCMLRGNAFFRAKDETWMRLYQTKAKREKVIPIPKLLLNLMEDYIKKNKIKPEQYIFSNAKGEAYNSLTFTQEIKRLCIQHGITCNGYLFRAHDYRHGIATALFDAGVSLSGVRDYCGHQSDEMTKQYIDQMPKRIQTKSEQYFKDRKE